MGHREDLLEGAKKCLYERGYAHTTARDIVAASGTNLASIGYHFGSKEALLIAAMFESLEEMDQPFDPSTTAEAGAAIPVAERMRSALESFDRNADSWAMTMEIYAQAQHNSALKAMFADHYQSMRGALTMELTGNDAVGADEIRQTGSVYLGLLSGLSIQRLLDPDRSPSADDVVQGLRSIADAIERTPGDGPAEPGKAD